MPWREVSLMSQRKEFVALAPTPEDEMPFGEWCQRYAISRTTGYKWRHRYAAEGEAGLADRSRRPHHSPRRTPPEIEAAVAEVRRQHPAWGGRKIQHFLVQQGLLRAPQVPSPSTLTAILRRLGLLADPAETPHPWQRFERPAPNQLWQMDFKGPVVCSDAAHTRCHPLTVLDDHSRFALALRACPNQQTGTVQAELAELFRRYGLPDRFTMDNGAPWGSGEAGNPYTPLTVWLLRLHVHISHSRPYHPQTQGKDERFHRTLQGELLQDRTFPDLATCQRAFDEWREMYNLERPHQALAYQVPAQRYQPSGRAYPEVLPPIEYSPEDQVRQVQVNGFFHFRGRTYKVSKAFHGYPVALRATATDGQWQVWFCQQLLGLIDLKSDSDTHTVHHVSVHV